MLSFPFGLLAAGLGAASPDTLLSPASMAINGIGAVLASTIVTPFVAGLTGLLYFDQRIRREALDMVLLREAGAR